MRSIEDRTDRQFPLGKPIVLSGTANSNAFLKDARVELKGLTASCYFEIYSGTGTVPTPDAASSHVITASERATYDIPKGHSIYSTSSGGELRISVLGTQGYSRGEFYA
jgi:hypothetical protein